MRRCRLERSCWPQPCPPPSCGWPVRYCESMEVIRCSTATIGLTIWQPFSKRVCGNFQTARFSGPRAPPATMPGSPMGRWESGQTICAAVWRAWASDPTMPSASSPATAPSGPFAPLPPMAWGRASFPCTSRSYPRSGNISSTTAMCACSLSARPPSATRSRPYGATCRGWRR